MMSRKQMMAWMWGMVVAAVVAVAGGGCGRTGGGESVVTTESLLSHVSEAMWLPRLDQADTKMYSSYDPAGGDSDYNHFLRDSKEPGWKVMVDLKGPGYVSRIFTTGAMPGNPFLWRFYFDGEESLRLEGDIQELFGGGVAPFLRPLAEYKNNCWYSFVPMPFAKSLRIECKPDWRDAKAFFQVSVSQLPKGTRVETFRPEMAAGGESALGKALAAWAAKDLPEAVGAVTATGRLDRASAVWSLAPDGVEAAGGAVLRRLEIRPRWDLLPVEKRDAVLRDWMLEIRWDGAKEASVRVPMGDFCGMPWRRIAAQGHYFGMTGDGALFNALPGPFRRSAEVRLVPGDIPLVETEVRATWAPLGEGERFGEGGLGFLHATFRKTAPAAGGSPHVVANTKGRAGKYVGCVLGVASLDGSYWLLEGDETIRKDDEKIAQWHGTGLEDYFNAGWYYRNVMTGPQHGVFFKEAHRTVQYRLHGADPCVFGKAFQMTFERLPKEGNHNFFESTAFLYFAEPGDSETQMLPPFARARPRDPRFEAATAMTALWNFERFDDLQGEREHLAARLKTDLPQFYSPEQVRMFELRLAALEARLGGSSPGTNWLMPFLRDGEPESVRSAAEVLRKEMESERAVTAYLYANMPVQVFVDGRVVWSGTGHPAKAEVFSLDLEPGEHEVALLTPDQPYPDWIFLAFRKGEWLEGTDEDWLFSLDAPKGFPADGGVRTEAEGWWRVAKGVHGPATEPYYFTEPDAMVGVFASGEGCGGEGHGLRGIRAQRDYPNGVAPNGVRKGFLGKIRVPE